MSKNKSFVLSDESVNTYGLNIRVEGDKLLADPVFDTEDEKGKEIAGKVERGFLKMASIGIRIVATSDDPKMLLAGQTRETVIKCRLREASIVGIGANHNALRLYDENDNELSEQEIIKLFDNPKTKSEMKFSKQILGLLQLSDSPTVEAIESAILNLHDEKAQAVADKEKAETEKAEAEQKLKDIADKEKAEKKEAFDKELADAFKDGRLSESIENPNSVKQSWENLYDKDADTTMATLKGLTPHKSASHQDLKDTSTESAWDKRQREIEKKHGK